MKTFGHKLVLPACALFLAAGVVTAASDARAAAPAPGEDTRGFQEYPLGDEQVKGPLQIAGVYFQPVDMEPAGVGGLPRAQADIHLEADISAVENNGLGYGAGDFVPYLTVRYKAQKKGGKLIEGTFMPMNASDGPHYGNNVKLDGPGSYTITFIVESPERMNYLLHVDKETGVPGKFWKEPIEVSWDFDFVPRKW